MKKIGLLSTIYIVNALINAFVYGQEIQYEEESFTEPYSFYAQPCYALGVMDGQDAIAVYPDFWGPIAFFTGEKPEIFQKRIKTRHKGYLPILECTETREHVLYSIEGFGATLTGKPEDEVFMFVKLTVKNETDQPRKATYWASAVYTGYFLDGGYWRAEFNPDRTYRMEKDIAVENGQLLYMYNPSDVVSKYAYLGESYSGEFTAEQVNSIPMSEMCVVKYEWMLKPGETRSTVLKVPHTPIPLESTLIKKLQEADYQKHFEATVQFWDNLLATGTQYHIPQDKTIDTLKSAFIDQLIAREKRSEDQYAQFVSRIQYPRAFFRDGIFIGRIYDLFGHPKISRENIRYIEGTRFGGNSVDIYKDMDAALNPPLDDTRDLSKYPQKLWRYCDYFLMCDDRKYAREILPEVKALLTWIEKTTAADERGLIPRCTLCDNEFVGVDVPGIKENGHRAGDNFWAMAAIRTARLMAVRLDERELVAQTERIISRFQPALQADIDRVMKEAGYIPGTLDHGTSDRGNGWGEDRDNILLVWPHESVNPFDATVTATIERMRSRYEYGVIGHYDGRSGATFPYRSIWMMEAMVVRGDQEWVVEDLYGQLAHTGSTHGSYEVAWKPRYGIEQHGWFNANYVSVIRNMLLREQWDSSLHLLSVVPAEWAEEVGNQIGIKDALTYYGKVSFSEKILKDGAEISLDTEFKYPPKEIVVHLPYFAITSSVTADGKQVVIQDGAVHLPSDVKQIRLYWETKPYHMAVTYDRYLEEFRKNLPPVRIPVRYFRDKQERKTLWKQIEEQPWKVIGPFEDINRSGFDTVYAPEKKIDFSASYIGDKGKTIQWQDKAYLPVEAMPTPAIRDPWYRGYHQTQNIYTGVDFSAVLEDSGTAYAYTNVWSPKRQEVILSIGSDGPITVWLNGKKLHSNKIYRGWQPISPDQDKVQVSLNEGWNSLLVKSCRGGSPWGFLLRILDEGGKPLEDLRFSVDKTQ